MTGIVDFLTARLDEAEKIAKEADATNPGGWGYEFYCIYDQSRASAALWSGGLPGHGGVPIARTVGESTSPDHIRATTAKHIVRNQPLSVLADLAAKRRIVARCAEALAGSSHHTTVESCDEPDAALAEYVLREMAGRYRGNADFDSAWALEGVKS